MKIRARVHGRTQSVPPTASAQAPAGESDGLLRKAGLAALVAFTAMLTTPIMVSGSDMFSGVDYGNPLTKQDPATYMDTPVVGFIFGIQGMVVAAALAVMVACVLAYSGRGILGDLMLMAGILPVACWMIFAGATAQTYSSVMQGGIITVQTDPAIRAMVGYAQLGTTQGLVGAAGIGLAAWALLLHFASRGQNRTGGLYLAIVVVFTAMAVVATVAGLGGIATLTSMPVALTVSVTLLRRSRSMAHN